MDIVTEPLAGATSHGRIIFCLKPANENVVKRKTEPILPPPLPSLGLLQRSVTTSRMHKTSKGKLAVAGAGSAEGRRREGGGGGREEGVWRKFRVGREGRRLG